MDVQFTDDQKSLVQNAIASGRYANEESALKDALSLWESRERRRAEILAAVDQGEAALAGSRRISTEDEVQEMTAGVKQRGRARLVAEQSR